MPSEPHPTMPCTHLHAPAHRAYRRRLPKLSVVALASLACGCNSGLGAILASSSGSDSRANSPTTISAFAITNTTESPATLAFRLTDVESDDVEVTLFYRVQGGDERTLQSVGSTSNPATFGTSPDGVPHQVTWDFAAEPGFPSGGGFLDQVQVRAQLPGQSVTIDGANSGILGFGNDPPVVANVQAPTGEVRGVVPIPIELSDSSSDLVSVRVEYEDEAGSWQPARPAGVGTTPEFALRDILAPASGISQLFFWDTDTDLPELERDVRLRFTPRDATRIGTPVTSDPFRVDNNAEPILTIREELLQLNPDARNGIPIPIAVFDEEDNDVEVVVQWRRAGEDFPELPDDAAELTQLLADPSERRRKHIAREYPTYVGGKSQPKGPQSIELLEIASTASAQARSLVGYELEFLYPKGVPQPLDWSTNPLNRPVSSCPSADGREVLVLDDRGNGTWALTRFDMASGEVVAELAAGSGQPNHLSVTADGDVAFVATTTSAGAWSLARYELAGGVGTLTGTAVGAQPGGLKGVSAVSTRDALATAGSEVLRVSFWSVVPEVHELFTGLADPASIVYDTTRVERAYVAVRGANGVVELDLLRLSQRRLPVFIPTPDSLVLVDRGSRLVVLAFTGRFLYHFDTRNPIDADESGSADINLDVIVLDTGDADGTLAAGPDGHLVLTQPGQGEIAVAGGVQQRRRITAYDPATRIATLDEPVRPAVFDNQPWRIPRSSGPKRAREQAYVWDSREAGYEAEVFLRACAIDSEVGLADETSLAKAAGTLAQSTTILDVADASDLGDIDGDGDLDVAVQDSQATFQIRIHLQEQPGAFGAASAILAVDSDLKIDDLLIRDVDGNGRADIVAACSKYAPPSVTAFAGAAIFLQDSSGQFPVSPIFLSRQNASEAFGVESGDLDGDGLAEVLVSVDFGTEIYKQTLPGTFAPTPLLLPVFLSNLIDLDADGQLDLVVRGPQSVRTVYFQTEQNLFDDNNAVMLPPISINSIADLDGNGTLDVIGIDGPSFVVLYQKTPRVFEAIPQAIAPRFSEQLVLAYDLDLDGRLDLLTEQNAYFQLPDRSFLATALDPPDPLQYPRAVGDVDGDGLPDFIYGPRSGSGAPSSGLLEFRFQASRQPWAPQPKVLGQSFNARQLGIRDLDGNGTNDLVLGDSLAIQQIGPAVFDSTPLLLPGSFTTATIPGIDLDGDLDQDVVASVEGSLKLLLQEGNGTFATSTVPTVGAAGENLSFRALQSADLDSDGDLDLVGLQVVGGIPTTYLLYPFEQTAPGTFTQDPTPLNLASGFGDFFALADLDGDGRKDLLGGSGPVQARLQDASGSFSDPIVSQTFIVNTFGLSDLDGDGDLDLVTASGAGSIYRYLQTSPGTFAAERLVASGTGYSNLVMADMDGDGDDDIVAAGSSSSGPAGIGIFYQRAPGVFAEFPVRLLIPSIQSSQVALQAQDVDMDGDVDIAISSPLAPVFIYWNQN